MPVENVIAITTRRDYPGRRWSLGESSSRLPCGHPEPEPPWNFTGNLSCRHRHV